MKILMVSMFSNHFFRWTEQLRNSGHEVHWIDVFDSNTYVEKINFVRQTIGWRNKIKYPGRYRLKKNLPFLDKFINKFNQRKLESIFESKVKEIGPDVVHSFVMYSASVPILNVMKKYPGIKWIYSAWGNDLYFYQNVPYHLINMEEAFPMLDFMFADCNRDYQIAKTYGFEGTYLGTFPTGGGYEFKKYAPYIRPWEERKIILIKGYQHQFGRCNNVLKALLEIQEELKGYEVVIFGANREVLKFIERTDFKNFNNLKVLGLVSPDEVMKLMGKSFLYIGNSISDGIPNTLLEAIIMGAFPIQSNPGGATSEIITDGVNGLLIGNPEDSSAIASIIKRALNDHEMIQAGVEFNNHDLKPKLERDYIRKHVIEAYTLVENSLKK